MTQDTPKAKALLNQLIDLTKEGDLIWKKESDYVYSVPLHTSVALMTMKLGRLFQSQDTGMIGPMKGTEELSLEICIHGLSIDGVRPNGATMISVSHTTDMNPHARRSNEPTTYNREHSPLYYLLDVVEKSETISYLDPTDDQLLDGAMAILNEQ